VTNGVLRRGTIPAGEQLPSESISRFTLPAKGARMTMVMLFIVAVMLIVVLRETRDQ
jgi:hypothetical protein